MLDFLLFVLFPFLKTTTKMVVMSHFQRSWFGAYQFTGTAVELWLVVDGQWWGVIGLVAAQAAASLAFPKFHAWQVRGLLKEVEKK